MILWIVFAVMTAAAALAVVSPLWRRPAQAASPDEADLAVYRDQLAEIDRDKATGVIGRDEAELARVEISRRLIAASDRVQAPAQVAASAPSRRVAALMSCVGIPFVAVALYLVVGSPDLPGEPRAERLAAAHAGPDGESIEVLFAKVEAHLAQHPDDGRGWEVIAPVYMRLGRYQDAVKARGNALRLLGATAERQAGLGEALVAEASGVVTKDAKAAFDAALRIDPTDVSARFYEGLASEQDGKPASAAQLWRKLLADAPPGAPWTGLVRTALARVDPSAAPPAEAGDASQEAMVRAMVARLAARLHADGSDPDGWVRLVRSYRVLGASAEADAAVTDARRALAADAGKLGRFETGLRALDAEAAERPAAAAGDARGAGAADAAPSNQMIRQMVERLAARLRQDGSDVDGWVRLVRSYNVLGDQERMRSAINDAHNALSGDPEKRRRFDDGVKALGIDG